jgi:hypothetical protein
MRRHLVRVRVRVRVRARARVRARVRVRVRVRARVRVRVRHGCGGTLAVRAAEALGAPWACFVVQAAVRHRA